MSYYQGCRSSSYDYVMGLCMSEVFLVMLSNDSYFIKDRNVCCRNCTPLYKYPLCPLIAVIVVGSLLQDSLLKS